jgi:hypothetical protein
MERDMGRKLHFITIVLILLLLGPLPLYAKNGGLSKGGLGRGGSGKSGLNTGRGNRGGSFSSLFGSSSAPDAFKLTPAAESHGIVQIKLTTQDAEIYIDGRFIGLASEFNGLAMVSVPSGKHEIEFKYQGSSLPTAHFDIAPGSVILIVR